MKLVGLLGSKPILNLMAIRDLQPEEVLFVGTKDTHTIGQHLQSLASSQTTVHQSEVYDPYDPPYIVKAITNHSLSATLSKVRKFSGPAGRSLSELLHSLYIV